MDHQNRLLTDHIVPGDSANHQLEIEVMDEPGSGGARHKYLIGAPVWMHSILFQNGPIKEAGVNGLTHEALLAIIIDRLLCFQRGPYASTHNAEALKYCQKALMYLQTRTRERIARGLEGTHQK